MRSVDSSTGRSEEDGSTWIAVLAAAGSPKDGTFRTLGTDGEGPTRRMPAGVLAGRVPIGVFGVAADDPDAPATAVLVNPQGGPRFFMILIGDTAVEGGTNMFAELSMTPKTGMKR